MSPEFGPRAHIGHNLPRNWTSIGRCWTDIGHTANLVHVLVAFWAARWPVVALWLHFRACGCFLGGAGRLSYWPLRRSSGWSLAALGGGHVRAGPLWLPSGCFLGDSACPRFRFGGCALATSHMLVLVSAGARRDRSVANGSERETRGHASSDGSAGAYILVALVLGILGPPLVGFPMLPLNCAQPMPPAMSSWEIRNGQDVGICGSVLYARLCAFCGGAPRQCTPPGQAETH